MSLDTVLKIGKALRESKNSLKYFKYVEPLPVKRNKDGSKSYPICITIPVKEDFSFDWSKMDTIPENKQDNLYYLKFKTSDNDSSPKKYFFGDIAYIRKNGIDKKGNIKTTIDYGNYTLEKGKKDAFLNAQEVFSKIEEEFINKYLKKQIVNLGNKKEQQLILKNIKASYFANKEVIVDSKIKQFEKVIKEIYNSLKSELQQNNLFKFKEKFNENIERVILLLKYAPAFESLLTENVFDESFFTDKTKLVNYYVKTVLENTNPRTLKQLLNEDERVENISEATKNKIAKYADFSIFIHFDFQGKNWYEFTDAYNLLIEKLNSEITDNSNFGKLPSKAIFRTLCSGNAKNDIQFPNFENKNRYKSFVFRNDDFLDFLYSESFFDTPLRRLYGTNIEFYVLPVAINNGNQIKAEDYIKFLKSQDEARIKMYEKEDDEEPLFSFVAEKQTSFTKFDFIFTVDGGNAKIDLIEISGIEQSKLKQIAERIRKINTEIKQEKKQYLRTQKEQYNFKIEYSFKNILGNYYYEDNTNVTTVKPSSKYQSHILKVLPLIYTDNYYNDEILFPAFIQNVEATIRFGDPKYAFLKFDLIFLYKIQNNNSKIDKYMEITNSKSYQIGLKIGKLAKPLKKAINSFEKNYVGLLSRRVNSLDECISFVNEIDQKLVMHGKTWGQMSAEVRRELAQITQQEYDKEKLSFGFFEGWFRYDAKDKKVDFFKNLNKIYAENKDNEEIQEEVEQLRELIENIKQ